MRVLLLPSSYPPVLGGVQTVAHLLAQRLRKGGQEVLVVTNRYPRSTQAHQTIDGIPVIRHFFLTPKLQYLLKGRSDLFLASLYFYPTTLIRLTRLFLKFRPDIVNVHFPDHQIPHVIFLRHRFEFRLVISLHGHEVLRHFDNGAISGNQAKTIRSILSAADVVTACSNYLLKRAVELEPSVAGKGTSILNGVDLHRFTDDSTWNHPRSYIFSFGRLTYEKGFDILLSAFANIANLFPKIDLILAGDGEERASLERTIKGFGLIGRIFITGRATPAEVVRLLNGCELVVIPSREEPFGIVALEAMAAGKPILAARVGGLPEIVDIAFNRFFEPNVENLTECLKMSIESIDRMKSDAIANKIGAGSLTLEKMVERYLEVYQDKMQAAAF